jgi:hypothetical protein
MTLAHFDNDLEEWPLKHISALFWTNDFDLKLKGMGAFFSKDLVRKDTWEQLKLECGLEFVFLSYLYNKHYLLPCYSCRRFRR